MKKLTMKESNVIKSYEKQISMVMGCYSTAWRLFKNNETALVC
jgi:hypothetical protein